MAGTWDTPSLSLLNTRARPPGIYFNPANSRGIPPAIASPPDEKPPKLSPQVADRRQSTPSGNPGGLFRRFLFTAVEGGRSSRRRRRRPLASHSSY